MESCSRPLGGISALRLGVASAQGAAPSLKEEGYPIPLLEDRSTYSEVVEWIASAKAVTHTLKFVTPIDYELPTELLGALSQGFVALIALQSRNEIVVGWSPEALSDRALRLVSCTTVSGERPSERGYKEWLMESIDSLQSPKTHPC